MKKIIFVVDFLRTIHAGTEHQLAHLLWNLPAREFAVCLISLQDSLFLDHEAPRLFPGVEIRSLGATSDISRSLFSLVRLLRIIKKEKPDIVHTFFPTSNSIGILLARLSGVNALISSRRDMGYNLSTMDILKLRVANVFVSAVIANAEAVKRRTLELEKIKSEKIHVVYNGILCQPLLPPSNSEDKPASPVVAIVANLNRHIKRVDVFIKSAAIVHKSVPDARFWVIGDGELRADLERLSSDLGLGAHIVFLGRRNDVPELLRNVSVGVLSSDSEGLSNAIMEYMAKGIPAVVTNVGGNPELVQDGENGYVVPPDNEKEMANALIKILGSPEESRQMGTFGFELVKERFSIQAMLEHTIQIYQKVSPKSESCTSC